MQLSERMVETAKPKSSPYTISDGTGLHLLVYPSGTKTYIWRWRVGTGFAKRTIGRVNAMKLADARTDAIGFTNAVSLGRNPALEAKAAKKKVRLTVSEAWEKFEAGALKTRKKRTKDEYVRIFKKDIEPVFGSSVASAITRDDCEALTHEVTKRSKGGGLLAHAVLSSFFSWSSGRGRIETAVQSNPMAGVPKPSDPFAARERNLRPHEIVFVLKACAALREEKDEVGRWATLVEVIMRTAQRDKNVRDMQTTSIRNGVLTINRDEAKNGVTHDIPLPKQVLALIEKVQRPDPKSPQIFQRCVGKSHCMAVIRAKAEEIAGDDYIAPWTLHDLRRTFNTLMFDEYEDADFFTIESILGHKVKGVSRHYNFAKLLKRKEQHLTWWSDYLDSLSESRLSDALPAHC